MISRPLTDNVVTPQPTMPPGQREILHERFRNVILGSGYSTAECILSEYFEGYMEDVPAFVQMLEKCENEQREHKLRYATDN